MVFLFFNSLVSNEINSPWSLTRRLWPAIRLESMSLISKEAEETSLEKLVMNPK